MLNVCMEQVNGAPLLIVCGRFDGAGAGVFDTAVVSVLDRAEGPVLLDMEGVDYLSSAGLRSLLRLAKARWARHARVWLVSVQPLVRQVFEMAGLVDQFELVASRAEAAARLIKPASDPAQAADFVLGGRSHEVTRLAGAGSTLDWWPADPEQRLTCLSLDELGVAVGRAGLGNTAEQANEAVGFFLSTGHAVWVRPMEQSAGPADFMVTGRPAEVPVYVAEAWRLAGVPSAFVAAGEGTSAFADVVASLPELLRLSIGHPAKACGWILAALEAEHAAGEGWISVGYRPQEGEGRMESVRVAPLTLSADPAGALAYLQSALRDETIADGGAPGPSARVGRWMAWLFDLAELCPARDRRLEVVFDEEKNPPEEWDWIARRMYAEAGRVKLRRLCGGFSAATFHAESYDREGRRLLPTVLKLADPAFSEREDRAYDLYVSTYILNNSAVRMGRCARNGWVGLRYNFLGITGAESRLNWIGDHLVRRPVEETLPLFEALFEKILAPWYAQARPGLIAPYHEHDPQRLFPGLVAEAQSVLGLDPDQPYIPCPLLGRELPNPYYLLRHVYPARARAEWAGMTSIVHGDLNLNNVLLDEKENLYVIDFSETHQGDLTSDFSRIEPLLLLQMTRLNDESDLAALLRYLGEVSRPSRLFDPPDAYAGTDPFMPKAHALVRLLRREVRQLSGERLHAVPYLLGLLRWSLPIVVFRQMPLLNKQASCFASAVLAEALLEADPEAAERFTR